MKGSVGIVRKQAIHMMLKRKMMHLNFSHVPAVYLELVRAICQGETRPTISLFLKPRNSSIDEIYVLVQERRATDS